MKKGLVLLGMIGITVFAGLIYSVNFILGQKEAVGIEYQVLEGDPAVAEGISFCVGNQWDGKLFWDSYVTIGETAEEIEVMTEFEDKFNEESSSDTYLNRSLLADEVELALYYDGIGSADRTTYVTTLGYEMRLCNQWLDDLAERTKAGEKNTQIVKLKDYQQYYDIRFSPNLSSGSYVVVGNEDEIASEFFMVKVPDSHKIEVVVEKDEQGKITVEQCNNSSELRRFEGSSVQTTDSLYFAFYGIDSEGQPLDFEMGSGNGIFRVPLEPAADNSNSAYHAETVINYNRLEKIFALPEKGCYPLELVTDKKGNLLLLTKEKEKAVLRIIDQATGEEKQKLELMDYTAENTIMGYTQQMDVLEDGLVIILNDNSFCFVVEEAGSYEKKVAVNLGAGPYGNGNDFCYDLDYQDGKLALLIAAGQRSSSEAYVYVLSEKGVEYKSHFIPSFANEMYYVDSIHLKTDDSLRIAFE